jgi:hypothetical protein
MATYYTREKSKFGGVVGTIQVYTTSLSSDNNPDNFKDTLPAGYLRCDGSILSSSQFPLLAAVLGTGSQSKFARDPDTLAEDEFQLPDLGSKYIRAANSSGGYLNDEVGSTGQLRAGAALTAKVLGAATKEISYNGNLKVLGKTKILFKGGPLYTAGDADFQTKNGLASSDTFQAHGHNASRRAILNYTGSWQDSPAPSDGPGFNYQQVQGANYLQAVNADSSWSFLAGQHKHNIDIPKGKTFNHAETGDGSGNHNFNYAMAYQEVDPFGLNTTVNLSTTALTKLDNVVSPFIVVEYIIKF